MGILRDCVLFNSMGKFRSLEKDGNDQVSRLQNVPRAHFKKMHGIGGTSLDVDNFSEGLMCLSTSGNYTQVEILGALLCSNSVHCSDH